MAPAFFKFFIAKSSTIHMKIPVAFTRGIGQPLPNKVWLRDRYNNIWIVKVEKMGKYWYFVDGWDMFRSDYKLTCGDMMTFEYLKDSNMFCVKVYGLDATEKEVNIGVEKETDIDFVGERHDGIDDETEDAEYMLKRHRHNEHEELHEQVDNDVVGVDRNAQQQQREIYPRYYGMDVFEAGLAEQPRNAYFVTKIGKRKSALFIPKNVIENYDIDMDKEIFLVDSAQRKFRVRKRTWKDGRIVLSGGWRSLCTVNAVMQTDTCICEFVQRENDRHLFLNITFVRASDNLL